MKARLFDCIGWVFCELAFVTDMRGTGWAYRFGTWAYGRAIEADRRRG